MSDQTSLDDATGTSTLEAVGDELRPDVYTNIVEDAYQRDDSSGDTTIITGLYLNLTQDLLPANKHLIVFADVIAIKTALTLPGRNMTLYARQLVSEGGSIDLTAPPIPAGIGNYNPGDRARDGETGANRGDNGKRGDDGANGREGTWGSTMTIYAESQHGTLTIKCKGGAGGRGQDAGNGGVGQQGRDGDDAQISGGYDQRVERQPTSGGAGGNGGNGGNGGRGGNGGSGGNLTLGIIRKLGTVTADLSGGAGGAGGGYGKGSGGGPGGVGGRFADCKTSGRYPMIQTICRHTNNRAASGPQGVLVGTHGAMGASAQQGPSGVNMTITSVKAMFVQNLKMPYRALLLRQAEMSYMNGDYRIASNLLEWLRFVAGDDAGSTQIRLRAEVLLTQLHQGLNYYGRLPHHVPLVTLDYYKNQLTSLLLLGQNIENARNAYNNQQATREARLAAIDTAITEAAKMQDKLKESLVQFETQGSQLQDEILQLSIARSKQRDVMMASAAAFKRAVTDKAQGCSFEDLLKFATTVISVGKAVYGDYTAISGAIGSLKNVTATLDGLQNAIKHLQTLQKSVSDIATQWQTLKTELSDATPDVSKIVAEQDEFDKMIKPYLDMPEAQEYSKSVHDYLGVVQAVNKKLLDYNGMLVSRLGMTVQIAQKASELDDIRSRRAQTPDPTAQHFRTYMAATYEDIRKHIMRYLFEEYTAYRYWALEEKPFVVQDRSMGGLSALHSKLIGDVLDALNERVTVRQSFQNKIVTLTEAARPGQFASFRAGHQEQTAGGSSTKVHELTFTVPHEERLFGGWWQVLATNFTIALPGVRTERGSILVQLIHSGSVVVDNNKGVAVPFSHIRRLADYSYRIADGVREGGGNLGGDADNKQYIGLSPYATWTIRIKAENNPGLDLSAVREITLTFAGKYYPSLRGAGNPATEEAETAEVIEIETA